MQSQKVQNSLRKAELNFIYDACLHFLLITASYYGENHYNRAYILTSSVIEHIFDILKVSGLQW